MWVEFPSTERCTANGTKSFHGDFNKNVYKKHPILEVLKGIQSENTVKMRTSNSGAVPDWRTRVMLDLMESVQNNWNKSVEIYFFLNRAREPCASVSLIDKVISN